MSSQTPGLNCTTTPWAIEPNSDISGIGILIGFAASAYSTLLLCIAYYLVDHKRHSNPVDQKCIDSFYRLFNQSRPSENWTKALEAAVLTFSDQQVITGIAILISGYSQLRGGLAVYYWQLTVDLAWFSSITHLTTLTCLRYYFQQRQGLRILRLICMAITAGMLSCALASTGYLGGEKGDDNVFSIDYPAWCLFHRQFLKTATGKDGGDYYTEYHNGGDYTGYYNTVYVGLVLLFLCVSYGVRVIQLFPSDLDKPSGLDKIRQNVRTWLSNFARSRLLEYKNRALDNVFPTYWASVYTLALAIYCLLKAAADLYSSMLWEITWLAIALAWGSVRIIMDRDVAFDNQTPDPGPLLAFESNQSIDPYQDAREDNVWGFGQAVAMALLLLPLLCFFESIYESVIMDGKNSERLPTSAPANFRSSVAIIISPNSTAIHWRRRPFIATSSSPGSSSAEPWTELYEYAWFRALVWLIYLLSLATASNVVFLFPYANGSSNLQGDFRFMLRFYLSWFGVDLAMLLLFTITSLTLCHVQDTSEFRWTWRGKRIAKRTKLIQGRLLIVSVFVLSGLSATFGWITLFISEFFFYQ